MNISRQKHQKGVGLIEVLVTLLVLTTSLIALATLQTRSLQYNHGSYIESQANIYAYDILDRMRANVLGNAALLNAYTVAQDQAAPATNEVAKRDINQWRTDIATNLPEGKGAINCNVATRICRITIIWSDLAGLEVDSSLAGKSQFEYEAML